MTSVSCNELSNNTKLTKRKTYPISFFWSDLCSQSWGKIIVFVLLIPLSYHSLDRFLGLSVVPLEDTCPGRFSDSFYYGSHHCDIRGVPQEFGSHFVIIFVLPRRILCFTYFSRHRFLLPGLQQSPLRVSFWDLSLWSCRLHLNTLYSHEGSLKVFMNSVLISRTLVPSVSDPRYSTMNSLFVGPGSGVKQK